MDTSKTQVVAKCPESTPLDPDKIQAMAQNETNLQKSNVVLCQAELYEKVSDPGDIGSVPGKAVLPGECSGKADLCCVNSERGLAVGYSERLIYLLW